MNNLVDFKNLKAKQWISIAAGLAVAIMFYQFINGVYTGIRLALGH